MGFRNDIAAGIYLIQQAIRSPNYSQGASGWTINQDGSAEFQNITARGTITGSTINGATINGATINGGTITGGDIRSNNYVAGTSGFDLNGNTNQIEINTGFRVGSATTANVQLATNSTQAKVSMPSAIAGETVPSTLFTDVGVVPGNAVTTVNSAAFANGFVEIAEQPGKSSGQVHAIQFATSGATVGDANGVKGNFLVGASGADVWTSFLNNNNGILTGRPALVLGDDITPKNRLFLSTNELLAVTAAAAATTMFLNEDSLEGTVGGVTNKNMRGINSTDSASHTTNSTAFTNPSAASITMTCPPSGVVDISMGATVTVGGTFTNANFFAYSIRVHNSRTGTDTFVPTFNVGGSFTGGTSGSQLGVAFSFSPTGLGLAGDTLTITPQFAVDGAVTWSFFRTFISATPTL
jgi:hypothetical protein